MMWIWFFLSLNASSRKNAQAWLPSWWNFYNTILPTIQRGRWDIFKLKWIFLSKRLSCGFLIIFWTALHIFYSNLFLYIFYIIFYSRFYFQIIFRDLLFEQPELSSLKSLLAVLSVPRTLNRANSESSTSAVDPSSGNVVPSPSLMMAPTTTPWTPSQIEPFLQRIGPSQPVNGTLKEKRNFKRKW